MGVVNYDTVDGMILGDSVNGTYLRDALGSVTATIPNKVIANTYRYKPYGGLLVKTGSSPDPKFQWVGTVGYRQTPISHSASYVRARHYGHEEGMWTTADPLWFHLSSRAYSSNPSNFIDYSGLLTIHVNSFIHRDMGPKFTIQQCGGGLSPNWIRVPANLGGVDYVRGDERSHFENGTSRIWSRFYVDPCKIGKLGPVSFTYGSDYSFAAIIGSRRPWCFDFFRQAPKPSGRLRIIYQKSDSRHETTMLKLIYKGQDPFIPLAPNVYMGAGFSLNIDYCTGSGSISVAARHSAFPWNEAYAKVSRLDRGNIELFRFTPSKKSFVMLFFTAESVGAGGFKVEKCKECNTC